MLLVQALQHIDYSDSHQKQLELVNRLKNDLEDANPVHHLLLVEHPHTYTLGKNANHSHLLINETFLKQIDAKTFQIERGGDITYHGPGQLVGYPILNLKSLNIGVKEYVSRLEDSIINTLFHYNIKAYRIDKQIGLWVDQKSGPPKKIAAIGIKVSQGITMHGFALNVNTDLSYFNHIVPCGISDKGVTSIKEETGQEVSLKDISSLFSEEFKKLFFS